MEEGDYRYISVARYNSDGELDETFSDDGMDQLFVNTKSRGRAVALQPDGSIFLAGEGYGDDGEAHFVIAGFEPDGTVDSGAKPSFGHRGDDVWQAAYAVDVSGARVLVAGEDSDYRPAISRFAVAAFRPN